MNTPTVLELAEALARVRKATIFDEPPGVIDVALRVSRFRTGWKLLVGSAIDSDEDEVGAWGFGELTDNDLIFEDFMTVAEDMIRQVIEFELPEDTEARKIDEAYERQREREMDSE